MAGRAWTLKYGPAGSPPGTVGDYIDDVAPGSVIVLDNGGRDNVTVWGDILTEVAHRKGIAGTVIDGINRDVALCLQLGYPVFSRDSWMRTGKDRSRSRPRRSPSASAMCACALETWSAATRTASSSFLGTWRTRFSLRRRRSKPPRTRSANPFALD